MKKLILVFLMGMMGVVAAKGQVTFQKAYGGPSWDSATCIQQTTDGGYIVVGYAYGYSSVYLIKTDSLGDTLWTKTFGGSGYAGNSVKQTNDGGYIIVGETHFGYSDENVYLIKTNSFGDTLWTRTYGGPGDDEGYSVQETTDGGFIVAGFTNSYGEGNYDFYLIKTDSNGDTLWTRTYGGTGDDEGYSVQQTTDGGYVVAGYTNSFGSGNYDFYVIKTNSFGDTLWTKTYGGPNTEWGTSVQQTIDGGYIIGGSTNSFGAGGFDVYIVKTDSIGDTLWTRTYGGVNNDYGQSLQQTIDSGYIITGRTLSFAQGHVNIYLIKTNSIGDTLWTKAFGATYDYGSFVRQTYDAGYIITGLTYSFGAGNSDFYLIKTDAFGNSGCNERGTATIVTTPPTQITSPNTFVSSGSTVTFPNSIIGWGATVTNICASVCDTPAVPGPISGNTLVCNGTTQTYTINSVPGATSYIWYLPNGWTGSSTDTIITVVVDTPSGNISVVSVNSCSISTTTRSLAISVGITPNQPAGIAGDTILCADTTTSYSIAAVAGATSYTWTLPSGWTGTSSTNSINISAGSTGGYVIVTANNECGVSPPDTLFVIVDNCFTGINTIDNGNGITLYPNPNKGEFGIYDLGFTIYDLRIIDLTGRLVYSKTINTNKGTETISLQLSNGIYYWEVNTKDGIAGKGKLVIIND